jgi:hypothetical protein
VEGKRITNRGVQASRRLIFLIGLQNREILTCSQVKKVNAGTLLPAKACFVCAVVLKCIARIYLSVNRINLYVFVTVAKGEEIYDPFY